MQLFKFLSRRTGSSFCKTILRRLVASRTMRPPVSLSKIVKHLGEKKNRTVVVVGTVTDDMRVLDIPKLEVAALRFTETARARITKAGGACLTIDELIMKSPAGTPRPLSSSFCLFQNLICNYNRHEHAPPERRPDARGQETLRKRSRYQEVPRQALRPLPKRREKPRSALNGFSPRASRPLFRLARAG